MFPHKFITLEDLTIYFPIEYTHIPVFIMSPEDGNVDYWSIQIAVQLDGKVYDCQVYKTNPLEIKRYKKRCLNNYKRAIEYMGD